LRYLGKGLNNADFVVDSHNRHERSVRPKGSLKFVDGDQTVREDGKISDLEALGGEPSARVEHALVFSLGSDDVLLL
jgi:hypothetical protein